MTASSSIDIIFVASDPVCLSPIARSPSGQIWFGDLNLPVGELFVFRKSERYYTSSERLKLPDHFFKVFNFLSLLSFIFSLKHHNLSIQGKINHINFPLIFNCYGSISSLFIDNNFAFFSPRKQIVHRYFNHKNIW